ncbi:hypothetical protein [Streptomyces tirandamycinicus]|uniref:Uncharacterized protein n=1 Tax=Streptomyces tirandamycinicus TaxID=2174846 RepID=A0A2S1T1H3_9ACTN|nr:hypothetical protein [Streptomyces tirandamycinicus]AWI32498.1 hypothetical protein DDW44_29630 [Streptomyces tirandamycinicus]
MDAQQVSTAFAAVRQRLARTPCRACRSRETDALIAFGRVLVSCENCGDAANLGPLHSVLAAGSAGAGRRGR